YVTGAVSGTHANPAVTLALALYRGFPFRKVLPYCAAQIAGGFLGAAIVYVMFGPVIDHFNAAHHLLRDIDGGAAGVFFTHPGLAVTPLHAFADEIILTSFLVLGIFAVTEEFNTMAPAANSGALIIGLLVAPIGASAGYLESWRSIRPAISVRASLPISPDGAARRCRRRDILGGWRSPGPYWAAWWAAGF